MFPFSHIFHEHSLYVKCFWRGFPFSHIFSLYWKHVAFWIRWWLWGNKSTNNPLPDEPNISDQKLGEIPFYICWSYYMNGPSFAEPLLTDPILNGEKWDFLVPRQAAGLVLLGTCSQQFANIWTSFIGSESPKAKIVTLALMRHGPKGSSRPPWQTSSRKRICLRSEFIFIPNARLLRTSDKSPPHLKTGIKMNTPARAEHSCALHLVGDLLRHLLHHLPRPLPLLWHRVLQLFVVLLFFWEERFSFLSPCFVLSLF